MSTGTIIGIVVCIILVGIIIWLFWKTKKPKTKTSKIVTNSIGLTETINNQKLAQNIPPEVQAQFLEAEKRFKEAKGEISQEKILWDMAKDHFKTKMMTDGEDTEENVLDGEHIIPSTLNPKKVKPNMKKKKLKFEVLE